jgi:hypothetical protein
MSDRRFACVLLSLIACSDASGGAWSVSLDSGSNAQSDAASPENDAAFTDGAASTPNDAPGSPSDGPIAPGSCTKYLGGMPKSSWVYADGSGNLQYKPLDANGDRIMDFSFAGYMGGGVAIPTVPVKQMVAPSGKDDTAAIQAAIDAVSKLPLQNGQRGAVLLAPGAYTLAGSIAISSSGVVLRGSGSGSGGTVITSTYGTDWLVRVRGSGSAAPGANPAEITDAYVPSGATSFHVGDATKIAVGDDVLVQRPVTAPWIAFMGMTSLPWLTAGTVIASERAVTAIAGNAVTVDIPLSDSLDAKYVAPPGGSIVKFTFPGRITQVGIEDIRFESPPRDATHQYTLVRVDAIADGWIRRVAAHNFTNGFWLGAGVKRVTVEDVAVTHDATAFFTTAAPFDFTTFSEQTLVQRCSSTGGNKIWYYATQASVPGPNALLKFTGTGMSSHVTAHQRWSTGLLVDSSSVQGGVLMVNNGSLGGGEGWSMGWGVVWNATSDVSVQAPPGAMNWSIGGTGAAPGPSDNGTYESLDSPVAPGSLYLAQLCARLGPAAVAAIGD